MDQISISLKQLLSGELVLRQEQLPREGSSQDQLVANTIGKKRQPKDQRTLLENLSEAKHTPDIPAPSDINLDLYNKPNTQREETSGLGFGINNRNSKKKNHKTPVITQEEAPPRFPASQNSSYTKYLNEISTQRLASIANHKILYIEDSETIKSNIEANRRLLWRTLVQNPRLQNLAKDTLTEYLNANNNKPIKFTFPPENETTNRVTKTVTPENIKELENDPDIQMSVLLAKAKTDPKLRISEGLNLKNILQIIDHMAYISAWKDDSKMANYQHNEPALRQILDFSIRSTQVQKLEAEELDERFPEINTVLSPEILEEKIDSKDNKYEVVIPLEEMFKKPSIINPDNLSKIAEAFKKFSDLDFTKDKSLDIFSVPVDPNKPKWPTSTYIRTYTDSGSLAHIAYVEPRLLNIKRPKNTHHEKEEGKVVNDQQLSPVNNHRSIVVNETVLGAQKLLSDLFNPDLYSKQDTTIAETCSNFETQYPSIAKNPLILINNDKYCNSGVIQYLCFNERFDEASEAFKRAMLKLINTKDKKFLENAVLNVATNYDNLAIKLCAVSQILSYLIDNFSEGASIQVDKNISSYMQSLHSLIEQRPDLNKILIEELDKEPRKTSRDCLLLFDAISFFYKYATTPKLFDDTLKDLIQKLQGEYLYHLFQEDLISEYHKKQTSGSVNIRLSTLDIDHLDLNTRIPSLKKFNITALYSPTTIKQKLLIGIQTGRAFTQEEIHQSIKEYYEQGNNYQLK